VHEGDGDVGVMGGHADEVGDFVRAVIVEEDVEVLLPAEVEGHVVLHGVRQTLRSHGLGLDVHAAPAQRRQQQEVVAERPSASSRSISSS